MCFVCVWHRWSGEQLLEGVRRGARDFKKCRLKTEFAEKDSSAKRFARARGNT